MKLTFLGAAREVTGSRFLLQAAGKNIMVDYGMEQGVDLYENAPLPMAESRIDFVFLTHAHIDHSGYLPLLYKRGFRGAIFATDATADLCRIMLLDSAHIQESDAEWKTRKAQRQGKPPVEPLYTQEDALGACGLFRPCHYDQRVEVCPGVSIRMVDVGHLLGSASIEVTVTEGAQTRVIVFSGDIGNLHQPLLRDPQYLHAADLVVMESTYGDRSHGPVPDYLSALSRVLQETFDRGGNVVIPSFAVGRTQEMLYFLRQIKLENLVHGHGDFPVYVDSPLANEATAVFLQADPASLDDEARALIRAGVNPLWFDGLKTSVTAEESKAINFDKTPKVILSASGMCDAGRIRHHLKHNLWRPECTVVFVGYQGEGTLGRALLEGVKSVKLFGEEIAVHAQIVNFQGLSSHADRDHLISWIQSIQAPKPQHVFVVHGDREVAPFFAKTIQGLGFTAHAPQYTEVYDLIADKVLEPGYLPERKVKTTGGMRASAAYERLVAVGNMLMESIKRSRGRDNKSLARFADQLRQLLEKWES